MTGNSVAPLSDGFLVTIPMTENNLGTFLDYLAGKPTGTVYKWTPQEGFREISGAELAGNNGIAVLPDEKWAFEGGYSSRSVTRISLTDDGEEPITAKLSFLPDNIRYSTDGTLLVTGQDCNILTVVLLTNGTSIGVSPSNTAAVNPRFPLLYAEKYFAVGREGPVFLCGKLLSLICGETESAHFRDKLILDEKRLLSYAGD